jgi:hypothetical protein
MCDNVSNRNMWDYRCMLQEREIFGNQGKFSCPSCLLQLPIQYLTAIVTRSVGKFVMPNILVHREQNYSFVRGA